MSCTIVQAAFGRWNRDVSAVTRARRRAFQVAWRRHFRAGGIHDLATVSSPTRKWSEVEPATVAASAVQRSHDRSLEDDAFRNDVARPCAVDPMTARCRFGVAGMPTGHAAAPSGTFAADGHGAPWAR